MHHLAVWMWTSPEAEGGEIEGMNADRGHGRCGMLSFPCHRALKGL